MKELKIYRRKRSAFKVLDYLESMVQNLPESIVVFDEKGIPVFINKRARSLFGFKPNGHIGHVPEKLPHPIPVFSASIRKAIDEGESFVFPGEEFEMDKKNGRIKILDVYIKPICLGELKGAFLLAYDVTDRVEIEKKMINSHKMETVGLIAGGFAHDFNNLLSGIMGYLELAKMSKDPEKVREYIENGLEISAMAGKLVDQILTFSKTMPVKKERINIKRFYEECVDLIKQSLKRDIVIKVEVEDNSLRVYADRAQLKQVMINLMLNSIEAIGNKAGGKVILNARKLLKTGLDNHEFVVLSIRDNGIGMNEDVKDRIFEPFFSTKKRGNVKGTGLGLSIVYRIIKNHDGDIKVFSQLNRGTTIELILPASVPREEKAYQFLGELVKGTGKIMVVEDEERVRKVASKMLETLGYNVVSVENGKECIKTLNEFGDVDLILLDLIMPGMDGIATLRSLKEANKKIPVVIASGYITLDMSYLKEYDYIMGIIKKPFKLDELSYKVYKVISMYKQTKK